jgi:predicted deacylase
MVCNVPAYESSQRSNPIEGLNLVSVFPGVVTGSITLRLADWITEKLLKQADLFGAPVSEVSAERTGVVIMLRRVHRVQVGDGLIHITNRIKKGTAS